MPTIYDPSNGGVNSSKGAMIQANMYAWMAEGLGRVDISADPVISFEYADMERKAKQRVVNPLAHIQFATSVRSVRNIFTEHGAKYTNKSKDTLENIDDAIPTSELAGNPFGEYYVQKNNDMHDAETNKVRLHSKFLLKPKIDSFNLIPKLAHDVRIGTTSDGVATISANTGEGATVGRTAGTYNNVATTTNGSGSGALLTLVIASTDGSVTTEIASSGIGYAAGDTLTVAGAANGLGGVDLVVNVASVHGPVIDLSAVRTSYVNFELTADGDDDTGGLTLDDDTGRLKGSTTGATVFDNENDVFFVYDLSNNGDDGSFNVLATFKIHAKSKGSNQDETVNWPRPAGAAGAGKYSGAAVDDANTAKQAKYRINGMPITTYEKTNYDVSFVFDAHSFKNAADGLEKKNGSDKVKYIAHVMSGSVEDMRFGKSSDAAIGSAFENGGHIDTACHAMTAQPGAVNSTIICTRTDQYQHNTNAAFITEAKKAVNVLDFSFTGITLNDTVGLELNSDDWVGDFIVPLTGDSTSDKEAMESGGLQCIHIPDSIRTLRNDAAQSLAANFAGLTELLGSIAITPEPDISMGEFNLLAFQPFGDASLSNANSTAADTTVNGPPAGIGEGNGRSAHGVFTISGDVLISKVKNFMLGSNYDINGNYDEGAAGTIAQTAITESARNQHIHKVVYWSNAQQGQTDVSKACLARDDGLIVPNAAGGVYTEAAGTDAGAASAAVTDGAVNSAYITTAANGPNDANGATGAFLTELSPQESAFFYIYPWASTEMCAISSANGAAKTSYGKRNHNSSGVLQDAGLSTTAGAYDFSCNPFRHYQGEYLDGGAAGTYAEGNLDVDSISIAVPTFKGWLDNTHGYYNTKKKRTEWYSFCDICANNNLNAVQINDISYVYQNLGPMTDATDKRDHDAGMGADGIAHASLKPNGAGVAKGSVNKSVLDIVFPDVTKPGTGYNGGTDRTVELIASDPNMNTTSDDGNDFCTLNFRVPLQAKTLPGKKRLDKVYNLNNGVVQLANESYELQNGFTAKVNATADNLSAISANVNELMNSYCPVIIRIMDEDMIGDRGHDGNVGTTDPGSAAVTTPDATSIENQKLATTGDN